LVICLGTSVPKPHHAAKVRLQRRGETAAGGDTGIANLDIDPRLLEQAVKVSGERTKTAAVTRALREYVARHEQRHIVELFAALDWDPQYDYKAERTR
jgi:hypothetical protein